MHPLEVAELTRMQTPGTPIRLFDVRRAKARSAAGVQIPDSQWRDPALWLDWKDDIEHDLPVVLYCVHGHEISQGLTAALRAMGADAWHLVGGIAEWQAQGKPVAAIPPMEDGQS